MKNPWLLLYLFPFSWLAGSVATLQWDTNEEADVTHYTVFAGTNSGNYTRSIRVDGRTNTTAKFTNLTSRPWFFAATSGNSAGAVSELSEEVIGTPPTKLRIITYIQAKLPNDNWRIATNFASQITMRPGVDYRSEVYSESMQTNLLLSTFIQSRITTNAPWINATNFTYTHHTETNVSYRTLVFTEVLP